MLDPHFQYVEPQSLEEAVDLLGRFGGEAVVLGGGTMMVPEMTSDARRPRVAIGIRRLDLSTISQENDEVIIGAGVSYTALIASELIARQVPLLHDMARQITGGVQIRNQGTLIGSAAFANPTSDAPTCLVALGARIRLAGPQGQRSVPAAEFFLGAFETARRPDEMLTAVSVPITKDQPVWAAYRKLKHAEGSWPIVTAACLITGRRHARVAMGAATRRPIVASGEVDGGGPETFVRLLTEQMQECWEDPLADGAYRRFAAPTLVARTIAAAMELRR